MSIPIEQLPKDFLVKINDAYKRIKLKDVIYLQSEGKYVSLVLVNRTYSFRSTLKELELSLPKNFIRTHSSYIVNLDEVVGVKSQENILVLSNGAELTYSRTYKEKFLSYFMLG